MYCRNCGRQVPGNEELCEDCRRNAGTIFPGIPDGNDNVGGPAPYNNGAGQSYTPPPQNFGYGMQPPPQPQPPRQSAQPAVPPQNRSGNVDRMLGFKPALAATIMGVIGAIFALVGYIIAIVSTAVEISNDLNYIYGDGYYYGYAVSAGTIAGMVIVMLIGLGLVIPSLILGIKSIKVFTKVKREGGTKPVATLVLGIVGVVSASIGLLFSFLGVIVAMTI